MPIVARWAVEVVALMEGAAPRAVEAAAMKAATGGAVEAVVEAAAAAERVAVPAMVTGVVGWRQRATHVVVFWSVHEGPQ